MFVFIGGILPLCMPSYNSNYATCDRHSKQRERAREFEKKNFSMQKQYPHKSVHDKWYVFPSHSAPSFIRVLSVISVHSLAINFIGCSKANLNAKCAHTVLFVFFSSSFRFPLRHSNWQILITKVKAFFLSMSQLADSIACWIRLLLSAWE